MNLKSCIYFMGHHLVWMVAFRFYTVWAIKRTGYRWKSIPGLILGYACLASLAFPLLVPACLDPSWVPRRLEFLLGWLMLLGEGGLILAGIIRLGSQAIKIGTLGYCSTERYTKATDTVRSRFSVARSRLQNLQWAVEQNLGLRIPLHLTEDHATPVLAGPSPHRIYVPFSLVDQCEDLEPHVLPLVRWATTKRHRCHVFLWWCSQAYLPLLPLTRTLQSVLEDERTAEQAGSDDGYGPRSIRPYWCVPVGLVLAGVVGAAFRMGRLDAGETILFLTRKQIIGYSPTGADRSTVFLAIPGQGGVLPDGLLIDTMRTPSKECCATVRLPLGLFEHESLVPFGAQAVEIHLDWRIVVRRGSSPLPVMKIAASEQGPVDESGEQRLWTFSSRNVFLAAGGATSGTLASAIHLHPTARRIAKSRDVLFGPLLFIPPGWRIEIRNYRIHPIAPERVPEVPSGEVEQFVDWYRRNQERPSAIDLTWNTDQG